MPITEPTLPPMRQPYPYHWALIPLHLVHTWRVHRPQTPLDEATKVIGLLTVHVQVAIDFQHKILHERPATISCQYKTCTYPCVCVQPTPFIRKTTGMV